MDEVVHLYTLLREAKDFITGEGEQLINSTTTIRYKHRRQNVLYGKRAGYLPLYPPPPPLRLVFVWSKMIR